MTPAKLFPFVRYALMFLAGVLGRGGWLPSGLAMEMATDPVVIELVVASIIGAGTLLWYLWSWSRKALVEAVK